MKIIINIKNDTPDIGIAKQSTTEYTIDIQDWDDIHIQFTISDAQLNTILNLIHEYIK